MSFKKHSVRYHGGCFHVSFIPGSSPHIKLPKSRREEHPAIPTSSSRSHEETQSFYIALWCVKLELTGSVLPQLTLLLPAHIMHRWKWKAHWWGSRTSNPVCRANYLAGGFDSHALPPHMVLSGQLFQLTPFLIAYVIEDYPVWILSPSFLLLLGFIKQCYKKLVRRFDNL